MSFIELIGFVISLVALVFLYFKNVMEARRRAENPEEELEGVERGELDQFLQAIEEERKKRHLAELSKAAPKKVSPSAVKKVNPPPLTKHKAPPNHTDLADYKLKSSLEERHIQTSLDKRKLQPSFGRRGLHPEQTEGGQMEEARGAKIIKTVPRLQYLVIYQEIMGKPKGW